MMLNRGRILSKRAEYREEISPMESMVNLVDVMLVFICGLLISIVIFWNVDMNNLVVILDQDQLIEIENPEEMNEQMQGVSSSDDIGSAIFDPQTGKLYVVDDNGNASGTEEETPESGK